MCESRTQGKSKYTSDVGFCATKQTTGRERATEESQWSVERKWSWSVENKRWCELLHMASSNSGSNVMSLDVRRRVSKVTRASREGEREREKECVYV